MSLVREHPAQFDAAQRRAGRDACRAASADLFFAAHFLPRIQRQAIYTLAAVGRQLRDILDPCPGGGAPQAGESACSGVGGCATCAGGETPQQRRAVCAAVLDFLYSGQQTGKPELDGFVIVARHWDIPRALFDQWADGLATLAELKLYATWSRLRSVCNQAAGTAGLIAFRALRNEPRQPPAELEPLVQSWAAAMQLAAMLSELGREVQRGRLALPLDDLVKFGLDRSEVTAMAQAGTAGGDGRWRALMAFEIARVRSLYRGGAGCLRWLPPPARRAAAILGETYLGRLAILERRGGDPFGRPIPATLWSRLARLPAAMQMARR